MDLIDYYFVSLRSRGFTLPDIGDLLYAPLTISLLKKLLFHAFTLRFDLRIIVILDPKLNYSNNGKRELLPLLVVNGLARLAMDVLWYSQDLYFDSYATFRHSLMKGLDWWI